MCLDLNHLTHSRVKINLYNPPSKFITRKPACPPSHLGLGLDFTNDLSWVHMPDHILQSYVHLHVKNDFPSLINFFSHVPHHNYTITTHCFYRFYQQPILLCFHTCLLNRHLPCFSPSHALHLSKYMETLHVICSSLIILSPILTSTFTCSYHS